MYKMTERTSHFLIQKISGFAQNTARAWLFLQLINGTKEEITRKERTGSNKRDQTEKWRKKQETLRQEVRT